MEFPYFTHEESEQAARSYVENLCPEEFQRLLQEVEAGDPIDNDVATAVLDYVEQHRGL